MKNCARIALIILLQENIKEITHITCLGDFIIWSVLNYIKENESDLYFRIFQQYG